MQQINSPALSKESAAIHHAIEAGIEDYFEQCRANIPLFIKKHFWVPGCWQTNRLAFGVDLLRAPINLLWAPIYLCLQLLLYCFTLAGWQGAKGVANWLPAGLTTKVQRNINALIQQELLDEAKLHSCIDKYLLPIAEQLASASELPSHKKQSLYSELNNIVDDALKQLMQSRTAAADISNTIFAAMVGAIAFKKFTPGGIGIGLVVAGVWVKLRAQQQFFLGETAGGWYYTMFPPQANTGENMVAIFSVMLVLSVIATFSGLITDPLQVLLGVHKRRLNKLVTKLEHNLLRRSNAGFKTLDPYVARILDLFDTVKSHIAL
ncbi:hypothetical protein QFX18_19915 [Saccharophagus degradans]|uniref:DUF6635 family protein n=1 Tax=Saccharophagus degradans TaxID=86304 RepID=UPI002477E9F0|nr:DUF6635 family protein [Saccharophagus degradans]WGO98279.1 hypothetical protein QFX18_19915 [Saccharophagus degradans]